MMFLIHSAFALGLMSLTAGSALYIWALRNHGAGTTLGRVVGFVVVLISTLSLICSLYLGISIWKEIYYLNMAQMHSSISNASMMKNTNTPTTSAKEHSSRK